MPDKKKILERAFEYANGHVLEKTSCPGLGNISNGWCDVGRLPLREMHVLSRYASHKDIGS
jgi:hypothetical protein